ncbi:MAG: DUF47 domain-containing protein [Fervidobacterium sp.]
MANIFNKLVPYKSPLELFIEHTNLCVQASEIMKEAIETYLSGEQIEEFSRRIDELEDKADKIKLQVREIYAKLKWTYFSKSDFLDVLHNVDSIMDLADDTLKMLTMNKVDNVPDDIKKDIENLATLVNQSVHSMNDAAKELRLIVESAFSPKEIEKEDEKTIVVEREEHSSDLLGIEIGKKLFAKKYEMNAVDLMFLNSVVILLMRIEDKAKNVVEKVRMITHK